MRLLITAWVAFLAAGGLSLHARRPTAMRPLDQSGLRHEASPPVPEPGASRPPVTPEPASGGGAEEGDGMVLSGPARSEDSNAGRVPPAKAGDAVEGSGLGFGNNGQR